MASSHLQPTSPDCRLLPANPKNYFRFAPPLIGAGTRTPAPEGIRREDFRYTDFDAYGRKVGYATDRAGQERLYDWLRENPHRLHLGQIGFELKKSHGSIAGPSDLKNCEQVLDLWSGIIESRFEFEGESIHVQTGCHSDLDLIAVRIESPLLGSEKLKVLLAFPFASPEMGMADWDHPELHSTIVSHNGKNRADFTRKLDDTEYRAQLEWNDGAQFSQRAMHEFVLNGRPGRALEFVCSFLEQNPVITLPSFSQTKSASERGWKKYWNEGGAIDLRDSADPRSGTGAADRAFAIQHGGSLRRFFAVGGNRVALQFVAREIPPGNALVAQRPLHRLEPIFAF